MSDHQAALAHTCNQDSQGSLKEEWVHLDFTHVQYTFSISDKFRVALLVIGKLSPCMYKCQY